jgi:DNA mismatch endonuclease Vsr
MLAVPIRRRSINGGDYASPEVDPKRRALMQRVRRRDTAPEMGVRRLLHRLGYRYRLHRRDLPGSPDIVFPARRKVLFVHGCFWHRHPGCRLATFPKTRREFWGEKFTQNVERDRRKVEELRSAGWAVCVVWQCELESEPMLVERLRSFLGRPGQLPRRPQV